LLVVHPRHDRGRGQLSNAYDLSPLLHALEGLPLTTPRPVLGVLPVAGEGMQGAAEEGVQANAPYEDPRVRSLVLVSDPPRPPLKPELPEELADWLGRIGERLGDAAPVSSQTRAARLLATFGPDATTFRARLDQAAQIALAALPVIRRRGAAGMPNGMPYCFAILEALLAGRPEPPPQIQRSRERAALALEAPASSARICAQGVTDETDGHPLWPAVATALAGMLAPSVYAHRVRPLRSHCGSDGALELVALDSSTARWIAARLGRQIDEALHSTLADPPAWRVVT
jgi:hypothetical protein